MYMILFPTESILQVTMHIHVPCFSTAMQELKAVEHRTTKGKIVCRLTHCYQRL